MMSHPPPARPRQTDFSFMLLPPLLLPSPYPPPPSPCVTRPPLYFPRCPFPSHPLSTTIICCLFVVYFLSSLLPKLPTSFCRWEDRPRRALTAVFLLSACLPRLPFHVEDSDGPSMTVCVINNLWRRRQWGGSGAKGANHWWGQAGMLGGRAAPPGDR
jgi:hypothetical protein